MEQLAIAGDGVVLSDMELAARDIYEWLLDQGYNVIDATRIIRENVRPGELSGEFLDWLAG